MVLDDSGSMENEVRRMKYRICEYNSNWMTTLILVMSHSCLGRSQMIIFAEANYDHELVPTMKNIF